MRRDDSQNWLRQISLGRAGEGSVVKKFPEKSLRKISELLKLVEKINFEWLKDKQRTVGKVDSVLGKLFWDHNKLVGHTRDPCSYSLGNISIMDAEKTLKEVNQITQVGKYVWEWERRCSCLYWNQSDASEMGDP